MTFDSNTIIAVVVAIAAVAFFFATRSKTASSTGGYAADFKDPNSWEIGPADSPGGNPSLNMPLHPQPHADGWFIDLPYPTADFGHAHYVTAPTESLVGKSKVTLRCRLEAADPLTHLIPVKFPTAPGLLTLFLQRKGDDYTAKGAMEAYRWWASFGTVVDPRSGEHVLEASFDQNWTAVLTSSRETNPSGFQAALENAGRIGFTLGGGDGLGHGVYASGPMRLVVTDFKVE